jgi:hypothetical protein
MGVWGGWMTPPYTYTRTHTRARAAAAVALCHRSLLAAAGGKHHTLFVTDTGESFGCGLNAQVRGTTIAQARWMLMIMMHLAHVWQQQQQQQHVAAFSSAAIHTTAPTNGWPRPIFLPRASL